MARREVLASGVVRLQPILESGFHLSILAKSTRLEKESSGCCFPDSEQTLLEIACDLKYQQLLNVSQKSVETNL